jgi:glucokinase
MRNLRLAPPDRSLTIGIDVGGTKIAGAVVDSTGNIVAHDRRPTSASEPQAIENCVVEMVEHLARDHDIQAVGVAAAGFIDAAQSVVHYAPNINWRQEPFRAKLEARIGKHIVIDNDANAAGWAEFRFGAGRSVTDMVILTIGTGVGGAIVSGNRIFRGGFGAAGELGHLRIVPDGLPCGCGARGCLEQYASGRALQRSANEFADAGGIGLALAARRAQHGILDGSGIAELIQAEDAGALAALLQVGTAIGHACASIGAILDPQMFVIGGGVAQSGDLLLDTIRAEYLESLPARGYHPEPGFRIAELVNDAGVIGAADLARQGRFQPVLV